MTRPRLGVSTGTCLIAFAAAVVLALLAGGAAPQPASAAPCAAPDVTNGADLLIQGNLGAGGCGQESESFVVYCDAGTVKFDYSVNGTSQGTTATATSCATPARVTVDGYLGGDQIDFSRISPANGFTGISQPNRLLGSFSNDELIGSPLPDTADGSVGADILRMRDGSADSVNCGPEFDFAQVDQQGTDSPLDCEVVDFLAVPAAPAPSNPTVQARKRKCKHKRKHRSALPAKKKRCGKRR